MSSVDTRQPARFFRPFSKLLEDFPEIPVRSYFSGIFYEFEEPAAWQITWDLPAYAELCARAGARSVLDAGCGSGRIMNALRERFPDLSLTGIDGSDDAEARFRERCGDVGTFVKGDLLDPGTWPRAEFDLGLLGNVTLNSFPAPDAARRVLANLCDAVRPGGHVLVVVFAEQALDRFRRMRELSDVLPFEDRSGRRRLIWRGVDFDAGTRRLRHNYFIEAHDGDAHPYPGTLGIHEERVWTSAEVTPMVEELGPRLTDTVTVHVDGGGAQGWPVDALLFHKPL